MKKFLLLTLILFLSSASIAETGKTFYHITYNTKVNDTYLFICVFDECQRSSSNNENDYIYDFGIFPISDKADIDLQVWVFNEGKKRIKRAPEYIPENCTINNCGSFKFVKSSGPATSTKDKCKVGLAICHKIRPR